jgi:hypothetical protein
MRAGGAHCCSDSPVVAVAEANNADICTVGERVKNAREKGGQNKSPCCVSWADEHKLFLMKRQDRGLLRVMQRRHLKVFKSKTRGQTTWTKDTKDTRRYAHVAERYARNKGESNQVSTR